MFLLVHGVHVSTWILVDSGYMWASVITGHVYDLSGQLCNMWKSFNCKN